MANSKLNNYVSEAIKTLSAFCEENKDYHLEDFDLELTKEKVEREERLTIDITFKK